MNQQIQELNDRVAALEQFIQSLGSSTTIPLEVATAISNRVSVEADSSAKTAASATISVVSMGVPVDVARPPAGFVTIKVNGVYRNIPYY